MPFSQLLACESIRYSLVHPVWTGFPKQTVTWALAKSGSSGRMISSQDLAQIGESAAAPDCHRSMLRSLRRVLVGTAIYNHMIANLSDLMPMQTAPLLKFVLSDTNGLPQRRSTSQRACEKCRKRKKRCDHVSSPASTAAQMDSGAKRVRYSTPPDDVHGQIDTAVSGSGLLPETVGAAQQQSSVDDSELVSMASSPTASQTRTDAAVHLFSRGEPNDSDEEPRFIGHLNPEGTFLAATRAVQTTGSAEDEEIGIWLSGRAHGSKRRRPSQSDAIYCPNLILSSVLLPHLEESCLSLLPASSDFEVLSSIYFDQIHPIFPIVSKQSLDASPPGQASRVIISQVMCLMASSSCRATPFLALQMSGARVSLERADYVRHLSLAVRTSLSLGLVKDKFTLSQIYALLSMSMQLSDDPHLSAEMCARAVAYAQTLGLHLPAQSDRAEPESFSRVFCCLWALDRLNAAFHGRPVCMHARDFGRDLEASIGAQDSCFQVFSRTALLLDKVIDLYRPQPDDTKADSEREFPDFESVVIEAGALRSKHDLLATVEIFYHAVAILSCRSQAADQRRSPSYVRQSLSAFRIIAIVAEDVHGQLSPLPVVPYAVSLALRFFYREFRFTKVPFFRSRAQKHLVTGCAILRKLGEAFVVAAGIANLVEQTLDQTDKVYSSFVQSQQSHESEVSKLTQTHETPALTNPSNTDPLVDTCNTSTGFSTWDNIPDFDVFEHLDPNFDLGAIDTVLADDGQLVFPTIYDSFAT